MTWNKRLKVWLNQETLLRRQTFHSLAAPETCWENKFCCFCIRSKTFFLFGRKILLTKHMFPSLTTMKTMLTSFQCYWGERITTLDGEVELGEPQIGYRKERGKNRRDIEWSHPIWKCSQNLAFARIARKKNWHWKQCFPFRCRKLGNIVEHACAMNVSGKCFLVLLTFIETDRPEFTTR